MILTTLCAVFLSFHASAADSVSVGNTEYILVTQGSVLVHSGEVKRWDEQCVVKNVAFKKTTTCTWAKTVSATATGLVVTDGATSTMVGNRPEIFCAVIAIILMLHTMACVHFNHISIAAPSGVFTVIASMGIFVFIFDFLPTDLMTLSTSASAMLFALLAASVTFSDVNRFRKLFTWSSSLHIALTLLVVALVW